MRSLRVLSFFGLIGLFAGSLLLSACSRDIKTEASYPDPDKERIYRYGSLSGTDGFKVVGGKKRDGEMQSGIGVNSFIWRAALDTISFMPLDSADPFGGVILTQWYEDPAAPGERTKVQVYVLSRELRADAVRVSLFREVRDGRSGWKSAPVAAESNTKLEDAILTRARELRQSNMAM